ncbi:hypothetical protein [Actinomadura keratinilytica]|jgi:hypothetical protein|uniref:Uncharacterized protein n=1 Tax=Actinomadura keratinilytica TaxID=547461 RepID=A0ABP7YRU2_9ACTN
MKQRHGRSAVALAGGLLLTLMFTGACSGESEGPGVANVGTKSSAAPGSGGDAGSGDPVAYAKCMRSNGLPNFPDPDANGAIRITGGPDNQLNPESAQFKKAQQACKAYEPKSGEGAPQTDRNAAVAYAKCMRDQGVTKFPDPDPQGGIKLNANEIDQNSPQFKKAADACAKYQPGGPGANRSTTGNGNAGG